VSVGLPRPVTRWSLGRAQPHWVATGGRVAVLAAVTGSLLVPGAARAAAVPVAVAAVLVGLPHGAADAGVLSAAPTRHRRLLGLAYLGAAVAVAVLAVLATVPVVLALLILAVVHFGTGEVETTPAPAGSPRWRRWAAVTAGGALVIAVPFAVHPVPVNAVLAALDPRLPAALPPVVRWSAVALAAACGVAVALADHRRGAHVAAGELALLTVLGLSVPPVLAFGVYFGLWHSVRHSARLFALPAEPAEPAGTAGPAGQLRAAGTGRPAPAVGGPSVPHLNRSVSVLAGAGSVAVAGVGVLVMAATRTPAPSVLGHLVLALLALTVPHTAVVAWLDRRTHRLQLPARAGSPASCARRVTGQPARPTEKEIA